MRLANLCFGLVAAGCQPAMHTGIDPLDFGNSDGFASGFDFAPSDLPRLTSDLPMDPMGPVIAIVSPNAGDLVAGALLTVTATVKARMGQKDVKTVTLLGPNGPNMPMAEMSRTQAPDEYQGTIDVSQLPSGPLEVAVVAEDLSGLQSSERRTFKRDAGPKITVVSPKGQTYRGAAPVLFLVEDPAYGVDMNATAATVQQVAIALKLVQPNPATWSGTIDFHSPSFKVALSGVQAMHLTAKNGNGTVTALDVPFTVDEEGPVIAFIKPKAGGFVGGFITIEAQIDDLSGVADNSVVAVIPDVDQKNGMNVDRVVNLVRQGNGMMSTNRFQGFFDTRALHPNFVYSNFAVRAADTLGNISQIAEQVIIDNTPPAIDLDPPLTRVKKVLLGKTYECSRPFDPLGDEVANDGDIQNQLVWMKARVEDRGNTGLGLDVEHPSLVVPSTVELYAILAADGPLAVDTNGDGFCDDVNPDLQPAIQVNQPKQALVMSLAPIAKGGVPDYRRDNLAVPPGCVQNGDDAALEPPTLCQITDLSYAIGYALTGEPSIWTVPPVIANKLQCQGMQIDLLNRLPDGPVCVTVRARDEAGNHNVAKPMRICVDKFGKGSCDVNLYKKHGTNQVIDPTKLPDCTGTVDMNGKVNNTPCKAGVKLNTGVRVDAFPMPGEPYSAD